MFERVKPRASLSLAVVALSCFLMVAAATAAQADQPFMTLAEQGYGTWWLDAEFHPFTTEVRGIPANKINKSWCKATEFRKDLLPKEIVIEENGGDSMEGEDGFSGFSFALEDNFDGSARKQIALVGVYEDCSGKTGNFFMILDQAAGRFKVRFLSAFQTDRQFLALHKEGKMIEVYYCLGCDHFSRLQWDRKQKKFVWLPSEQY
jgi:hypothetical protein